MTIDEAQMTEKRSGVDSPECVRDGKWCASSEVKMNEAEAKYKIHLTPENPIVMDQEDDHRKEINKERRA